MTQDIVDEAARLIRGELCPGIVMRDEDRPHYERAAKAVLALIRGLEPTDAQLTEWVQWLDWDAGLTTADEVKQLRSFLKRFSLSQHPPETAPAERVREALTLAEDVLSRAPMSTQVWPNGLHPQTGIEKIRAALALLPPETVGRISALAFWRTPAKPFPTWCAPCD